MIRAEIRWLRVEAVTGYQKLDAELQVRALLRETLNDEEPYLHVRAVSTEPLLAGAPRLSGVPEGSLNKTHVSFISPVEGQPEPAAEEGPEKQRQFTLVQGDRFTVRGWAEFPAAADPSLRSQMLLRGRFFRLVDAALSVVGTEAPPWQRAEVYVNRDLVVGLYLG